MYRVPGQDQALTENQMPKQSTTQTEYFFDSAEKLEAFGRRLAGIVGAGDVIFLIGELGAGKTTLARGIILSISKTAEDVTSPTYNLIHIWDGPNYPIWHADLYRLQEPAEVANLGLEDAFDSALSLVEWPDRMGEMAPAQRLDICLFHHDGGRKLTLRPHGQNWKQRLNDL